MARRRSKKGFMNWLIIGALVLVSAAFSGLILKTANKVPVLGGLVNNLKDQADKTV